MPQLIADMHIHSKYSRACSPELNLPNIDKWCCIKGIDLISTGDFTHPIWFKNIEEELVEEGNGFLRLRDSDGAVKFILGTEVSCIYSQGGQTRRVHLCLFFPDLSSVKKFNKLTGAGKNCARTAGQFGNVCQTGFNNNERNNAARRDDSAHYGLLGSRFFGSKSG